MVRHSLALILSVAVTVSSAQKFENSDYRLTVDVQLVQLPVSVLDKRGLPVLDLRRDDFAIYEDKVSQNISVFLQEDIPVSVGLVIDSSGSMADKAGKLKIATGTFLRESN